MFDRNVSSRKKFLILPYMFTGRVRWGFTAVMAAANVGTSLSMALSVLDLCPLTEWLTCKQALVKISIVSAILRGTATTLTKDKCALDSGSEIATDMGTLVGTQDGIQYHGSLLKKFLKRKLKRGFISGE